MRAGATDTAFPAIDHVSIHAGRRFTTTVSHLAKFQGDLFAAPAAPQPLQPQWLNYQETTPLGTNDGPIDGPMDDLGSTIGGYRAIHDEDSPLGASGWLGRDGETPAGPGGGGGSAQGGGELVGTGRYRAGGGHEIGWRRTLRILFVVALLVPVALGVRDMLRPFLPILTPRVATPAVDLAASYPREPAEAFAARFAIAYETYDSSRASARQLALKPYLADGVDAAMGWDGVGSQTALQAVPAGIDVRDGQRASVTVAVRVDNGRWIYLSVPVFSDQGGLVVTGQPSQVPAPKKAAAGTAADYASAGDTVLAAELRPSMEAFFTAYAHSDSTQLSYYAAPGVSFAGLGGVVDFAGLQALTASAGPANQRTAFATVRWKDSVTGAGLLHSYRLQMVQADGKWLVGDLSPSR